MAKTSKYGTPTGTKPPGILSTSGRTASGEKQSCEESPLPKARAPVTDVELLNLIAQDMVFVEDERLSAASTILNAIALFSDLYDEAAHETVVSAAEFSVVVSRLLQGFRPMKLVYLEEFQEELEAVLAADPEEEVPETVPV